MNSRTTKYVTTIRWWKCKFVQWIQHLFFFKFNVTNRWIDFKTNQSCIKTCFNKQIIYSSKNWLFFIMFYVFFSYYEKYRVNFHFSGFWRSEHELHPNYLIIIQSNFVRTMNTSFLLDQRDLRKMSIIK